MATKTARKIDMGGRALTLGTDPEFELVMGGRIVSASGQTGYSSTSAAIGCDGAGGPVEMRPGTAATPEDMLAKMRGLFKIVYQDRGHKLTVSGEQMAIGAHIHFGFGRGDCPKPLVQLLDDFLGRMLLPLSGSRRGGYGQLGAVEQKSYGFEYRSLPAAIFHNPRICGIVFKLAKKLFDAVAAGDVTYETDQNGVPTRGEFSKWLSLGEVATLFSFVEKYAVELKRCRETGTPLMLAAGEWLGTERAPDELIIGESFRVTVSGSPDNKRLAQGLATMFESSGFNGSATLFVIDAKEGPHEYSFVSDIPVAGVEKTKRRYVVTPGMLGVDRRLLEAVADPKSKDHKAACKTVSALVNEAFVVRKGGRKVLAKREM